MDVRIYIWSLYKSLTEKTKEKGKKGLTTLTELKFRHDGNAQLSYRSGRMWLLCPRNESVLVQNVQINSRTKAKEAGKTASLSTVKLSFKDLHF